MSINLRCLGAIPSSPSLSLESQQLSIQPADLVGDAGVAMGVMGMTYTHPTASSYSLIYKTKEGPIISSALTYGG